MEVNKENLIDLVKLYALSNKSDVLNCIQKDGNPLLFVNTPYYSLYSSSYFDEKILKQTPLHKTDLVTKSIHSFISESNGHCLKADPDSFSIPMFKIKGLNENIIIFKEDCYILYDWRCFLMKNIRAWFGKKKNVIDDSTRLSIDKFLTSYNKYTNNIFSYHEINGFSYLKLDSSPVKYFIKYNNSFGFELTEEEFNELCVLCNEAVDRIKEVKFTEEFNKFNNHE